MVAKKTASKTKKKLVLKKEDLKKVAGGRTAVEDCTATCGTHWGSFNPNCGTSCNATK